MKNGDLYFSLVGPDRGQWRLTIYEWQACGAAPDPNATHVRPKSGPFYFDSLEETLEELTKYEIPRPQRQRTYPNTR